MGKRKTKQQTIEELQIRLQELEDTLGAIRSGTVDAIVTSGPTGDRVYTLEGADYAYHMMVESMNEGAVTMMTDGTILYVNRTFGQMTGASPSEIVGRRIHDFVSVSDHTIVDEITHGAGVVGVRKEIRLIRKSAGDIPVQISVSPINLGSTEARTLVVTDLSDQKRLEEVVASEQFSRMLFEQAQEGIAVCIDGCIVRANNEFYQICGCLPLMQPFDKVMSLIVSESETFSVDILQSGKTIRNREVRYQRPDGKSFDLILNAGPLIGREGAVLGSLISLMDVTGLKQAEQHIAKLNLEMQRKIQDLEAVFNTVPIGLSITNDPEGRHIRGNLASEQMLGVPSGGELSKHPGSDPAPARYRVLQNGHEVAIEELPMQRAVRGEIVSNMIVDLLREDGRTIKLFSNASPLLDEQGRPRGAVGAFLDITEISLAQDALKRNDATLRGILNATKESVWLFSSEGIVLMTNDMALLRFGKSAEEVTGRSITEILPAELAASRLEHLKEVVETGQPIEFEDKRIGIHFRHSFYPVMDADGRVISIASFSRDVTERKQAERALQDSEARLRFALETIHAGAWDLDLVDHTAFRSLGHDRIFGYAELLPQWTYEMFLDHVLLEDHDEVDAKFRHAIETQGDWSFECRIRRTDGEVRWILAAGRHRADTEGASHRMTGIVQDITERKQAEEALRVEREQLLSLFDSMDTLIYVTDPSTNEILYVNKKMENVFGGQVVGGICHREFQGLEAPCPFCTNEIILSQKPKPCHWEYHNPTLGRDYSIIDRIIKWPDGRDVRFEIATDITDRKQAEEALRKAKDELEERVNERTHQLHAESLYARSLIEASPDPLVTISIDGKITDVNNATENATGVSRELLIGSDFSYYFTEPEKAKAGYEEVFRQGIVRDYPLDLKHRDGHVTPVLYNATVYRDEAGQILGVFAAARDITKRKRAEETVKAERQRLYDVLETLPVYAILLTPDYHVSFANRFFRERFGESHGRRCYEYLFNRIDPCENCESYTVQKTGKRHHSEWTGPDGRNYDIFDIPFIDSDGSSLIMEVGIDVTERKQAEGVLRKLASELVMAEERERKRIAGVLHDEVAQTLAAARMRIDMLEGALPSDQKQTLKEAKVLLVQSIQETRSLMNDLGNPLLFDIGLKAACESLADRLMESHSVRITCDIRDAFKYVNPDIKTILFQLVRELLANIVKHSQARNARVMIDMENGHFRVKVTDDGVGFDPQTLGAPTVEGGFGLYSIRERLLAINGTVRIESAPGSGTVVTAILPTALD